eukprot:TRINITY_DN9379_c0_g1_i1.p1 TRINITY_DN9379_c0_g1~~TRINITY_DN9379_c0_g1_i1.p1  ORF type:complete len:178 (+),score=18.57 TRINITY_DN9379_c0_g1_i1:713-1246(+)
MNPYSCPALSLYGVCAECCTGDSSMLIERCDCYAETELAPEAAYKEREEYFGGFNWCSCFKPVDFPSRSYTVVHENGIEVSVPFASPQFAVFDHKTMHYFDQLYFGDMTVGPDDACCSDPPAKAIFFGNPTCGQMCCPCCEKEIFTNQCLRFLQVKDHTTVARIVETTRKQRLQEMK